MKITNLLGIKYPIIQAGMVWCSGWELASASSNNGILGVIGAGSMYPDVLKEHIAKCKNATKNNFAVNIPMLYPQVDELIQIVIDEKVPVVITSAGNPAKYTSVLKSAGIIVLHVVANEKFALKAQNSGVDAIIAEGFEAGGHNGREETTTICLIPQLRKVLSIPIVAAGGISSGESMLAALSLGADGVQIGSRFAVCSESSAHINYKNKVIESGDGCTALILKKITPVRLIKNKFYEEVEQYENDCKSLDDLRALLGKGRAKKGIFEGELDEGEIEIGQVASQLNKIESVEEIVKDLIYGYNKALKDLSELK